MTCRDAINRVSTTTDTDNAAHQPTCRDAPWHVSPAATTPTTDDNKTQICVSTHIFCKSV